MAKPPSNLQGQGSKPAPSEGRVPPYSQESEAAVLGGILLKNDALPAVQEILNSEDFYVEAHRRIYSAVEALSAASQPVDHVTLGNELKKRGDLDKIGGVKALADLTEHVATAANVEHYARIVKEKAAVRRMIYAAAQVMADGYGDYGEAEEFLDAAESAVFEAAKQRIRSPYQHITEILNKTFGELELAAGRGGEITGTPSGFALLDKKTAGFQPSDLVILAGRPSMGKTALALNMAVNAAMKTKFPVLIFSLEMSKDQVARRMLAAEGRVDASKMRSNSLAKDDWPRLIEAANRLSQTRIYVDDSPGITPLEIRAKCRRLAAEGRPALVVVDYMQLMRGGSRRTDNREQEISEISRSLKGLAKELDIPIVALSQLNRAVESRTDKRPMMSDLRESGAIEQDADLILFVYRDEFYHKDSDKQGITEIIIGKQRSGPIGTVEVRFFSEYTRFENLAEGGEPEGY
ncbi:MAG: replicative DNA helicase [Deltaproteobacteria bacterium]|nr:replicative DNA helicase [Deltaproteobacteria bacterium]